VYKNRKKKQTKKKKRETEKDVPHVALAEDLGDKKTAEAADEVFFFGAKFVL